MNSLNIMSICRKYTDELKEKLNSLDFSVLNKFSYINGELLYNGKQLVNIDDLSNINPFGSLTEEDIEEDFKKVWVNGIRKESFDLTDEDVSQNLEKIWEENYG